MSRILLRSTKSWLKVAPKSNRETIRNKPGLVHASAAPFSFLESFYALLRQEKVASAFLEALYRPCQKLWFSKNQIVLDKET